MLRRRYTRWTILARRIRLFDRRLELGDRSPPSFSVDLLIVVFGPASATRQSREPHDSEEDAGESDAVRDELRGVGEAPMDADQLPSDVEDPEVRALVPGGRRRQVELRVSGRPEGHVAVDFVLCDDRGPNVSPQGVRFPRFGNERRDEDRGQAGARGARGGGEPRGAEEGSTGEGGLWRRGPVPTRIRVGEEDEEPWVRRRDAVLGPEGRQLPAAAGIRPA